ncbi:exonuclease subunit SbcD [Thalassotalea ganghwensis]
MTFRILHTSDWHLGQFFYGKSRAREHQQFFDWLLTVVVEHEINAIIVAGDIFDTGTPPSYAREMYFEFIVNLQKCDCHFIVLAGNHDSVAMLSESQSVLKHLNCHVIAAVSDDIEKQIIPLHDAQGNLAAVVCAIPFIRQRDIMTSQAGQDATTKQQTLQEAIKTHYQSVFANAKALAGDETPVIATGHLTTVGAKTSDSVRDIYIGNLEAFPAQAFPDADYIALGHIHRSQKVAKRDFIRYSGSPIPLSFDECKRVKQVLVVNFEQGEFNDVTEINVPVFQPMASITSQLDNLASDLEQLLTGYQEQIATQKLWLDIEIDSHEYHSELITRIEELVKALPVEVLLVRREKRKALQQFNTEEKVTLDDLNVEQVFEARLAQQEWLTDQDKARKERLLALFRKTVNELEIEHSGTPLSSRVTKEDVVRS